MARRVIKLNQIGQLSEENLSSLVAAATLEAGRRLKIKTPVDTGRLRSAWQTDLRKFKGSVSNNVEYAAPVVAGVNLPPSWNGQYRTRQNAEPFLDIVAKDVQTWIESNASRIASS
jgi:hypothetical protein|tara:strand:- start:3899 stop:4246 length:348 start_codon:yes stop_codon:yes gene_type:complete